jgi:diguanylate cyclase (GGDEF)-like protein
MEKRGTPRDQEGPVLSLIMLDVDHFKQYNDTHGHSAGDVILQEVASRLQNSVRGGDLGVRYGGEEFLVVLPGFSLDQAFQVAERIRLRIERETPVTVSLGVSELRRGAMVQEAIDLADGALYRAKESGRNRAMRAESRRTPASDE